MSGQGFTDLRINRQEGENNESFWPSFTDIMTVIVMIFLIAMVILLLRNMELVKQLRATMEAERSAMELAKTTGEEKESLALRLNAAENTISRLQLRNLKLEEEKRALEQTSENKSRKISVMDLLTKSLESDKKDLQERISNKEKEITAMLATNRRQQQAKQALEGEKAQLKEQVNALNNRINEAEQKIAAVESRNSQLSSEVEQLTSSLKSSRQQLSDMRAQYAAANKALEETRGSLAGADNKYQKLREQHETLTGRMAGLRTELQKKTQALEEKDVQIMVTDKRLADLQGDHSELQFKYDKLVKPARTATGKYIVEVRYFKRGGRKVIEYKEPGGSFRSASRGSLESRLRQLRNKDPDHLYIKIILPENSGLSYGEALRFTTHLHKNYDYYYR